MSGIDEDARATRFSATKTDFEELFRQAPSFFAVLRGPTHIFEQVNEAYLRLIGHRAVLGKTVMEALPELSGQGFDTLLDEVYKSGKPFTARSRPALLNRTPGSPPEQVYVDFIYQALRGPDNAVIGILVHGSDVTAQVVGLREAEASEDQFRTALNAIPALAWIADADGWIFWYNLRWFEYTGTTSADMEGWGWQTVHDPKILPDVMERWTGSIASGEPFEMEFPLRSAGGEMRWFLTRVSPLRDHQGKIQRWFGTNTDVHIQREAAEAARAANQAKSDFLAAMSHETRQPINATLGFLDVLEMGMYGTLSDEQRQAMARIRTNQQQLLAVITDILSFARLEAGKVQLQCEPVSCSELVAALPALVQPQVDARGLTLVVEQCPPELTVSGDRNRIFQICTNLITNSTRATDRGGRITVCCVPHENSVDLQVEDTGSGIPADKLEKIFAPFVQLDRALSQPREGVGLGLAISRDLATGMGGTLSAESALGKGSVFTLRLPRVAP